MADDDPMHQGNGEEEPDRSAEASDMVAAFVRIRDAEKRRILLELIRAIAEDQPKTDGV